MKLVVTYEAVKDITSDELWSGFNAKAAINKYISDLLVV
ncbi:hypothetical protein CAL7102_07312 [Dulcicalothrix desertica PCC 7102]|nr:hypothetical protein CAL7102_07312 [Dulcicalothrix desertica PCC 7102]